jgi:hypothetical protein
MIKISLLMGELSVLRNCYKNDALSLARDP